MSSWKIAIVLFTLSMLIVPTASSQMQFVRAIDMGSDSWVNGIIRTGDGRYVVMMGTRSHGAGNNDILVVKCDDKGKILWATTVGWDGSESGWALVEEASGTLLLAATTNSCGVGGTDVLLVKLDPNGNVLGAKTMGWDYNEYVRDLIKTADGGYALIGSTDLGSGFDDDILFMKLNPAADPQWVQIINTGGENSDYGVALMQTTDYGYALLAETTVHPYDDRDVVLCRLNLSGGHQWTWKYGGMSEEVPESFIQTEDDGWVIVGHTGSYGSGNADILMMRVDPVGSHVWTRAIGGTDEDRGYQVIHAGAAYALVGYTWSYGAGEADAFLAQFDHLWSATSFWILGGEDDDFAKFCVRASDGSCVKAARSRSYDAGLLLVKYDDVGETCIGELFSPGKVTVTPEFEAIVPELTYVAPTVIHHNAVVTHPDLTDSTICRDPVTIGDADFSGLIDIDDVVYVIDFIFLGGPLPDPYEAGDANCSLGVDIDDVVYLIQYIFSGGYEPGDPDGDGVPDC